MYFKKINDKKTLIPCKLQKLSKNCQFLEYSERTKFSEKHLLVSLLYSCFLTELWFSIMISVNPSQPDESFWKLHFISRNSNNVNHGCRLIEWVWTCWNQVLHPNEIYESLIRFTGYSGFNRFSLIDITFLLHDFLENPNCFFLIFILRVMTSFSYLVFILL